MFQSLIDTAKRNHFSSPFLSTARCEPAAAEDGTDSRLLPSAQTVLPATRNLVSASAAQIEGEILNSEN